MGRREGWLDGRTAGDEMSGTARTLVVLDPERPSDTLRAAMGMPGVTAEVPDLMLVYSDAEYERRSAGLRQIGYRGPVSVDQLAETARQVADRAGREWLSGGYGEAYGDVGRVGSCVARAVDERGYTQVYAPRPRRTLLGRLLRWPPADRLARALPDGVKLRTVPGRVSADHGTPGIDADGRRVDD